MVGARAQAANDGDGAHLVHCDVGCGLCGRLLQFVLARDRRAVFRFASLQSAIAQAMVERSGGDPRELSSLFVFANYRTPEARVFTRSGSALFVAGELGWPWTLTRVLGVLPTWLLDRAYDAVARRRYRVFGRADRCQLPRPEYRSRFVE